MVNWQIYSNQKTPFTMEDNQELTNELLKEFIEKHRAMMPRYDAA